MLEFPQPAITKSRTAKAGATSRRGQRRKPNLISPSYNRVRLSGRAKAKRYFWGACASEITFRLDRKSTRLNSSHTVISYAVFCLKKKNIMTITLYVYNYYYIQCYT